MIYNISSTTAVGVIELETYALDVITSIYLISMCTTLGCCVVQVLDKFKEISSPKSDQACAADIALMWAALEI